MEPTRGKSICVPFDSDEHYAVCVADPESFRQHLTAVCGQHPELFPARIDEGLVLHDKRWSIKQQLMLRRIELKATAGVFLVRPSFLMPYMVGRTEAVAKALSLRHWGVPFDALVYVFGRDALDWYRAEMALGRPAIVGSTVKQPEKLPEHLLADEKHTWALGQEVYVPTTVGGGCILGATVADAASADALEAAYGEFAQEARELSPTYSLKTVCTDGWEGTQSAWKRLFPMVGIILCFLHAVLKIAARCGRDRAMRRLILGRVWAVYDACTRAQFSQRLRRLREWATVGLPAGALRQMVLKLCGKRAAVRACLSLPWCASHLQRPRSTHEPSGPAPLRDALSAWHARCRPSRRARHGLAVELPPLRGSYAPRRPDAALAVLRPQWLRVSPQLAPQPAHRRLHGRAKTMNHEIRWNQAFLSRVYRR